MNARRLRSLLLALLTLAACGRSLPPPVTPVPPVQPQPAEAEPPAPAEPAPAEQPEPPPPPPLAAGPAVPLVLKVGLATDLTSLTLPCCDGGATARVGDRDLALASPIAVEPAVAAAERGVWRLQAAALRDERQAQELARRLERQTGEPGDAHFDAGVDLYRVRIGRWATREQADSAARRLAARGLAGAFVVSEGGRVSDPALRVTQGPTTITVPGRWLTVEAAPGGAVRAQGRRYRGRVLVYLNDRGLLNLINELPLDDYLRGVVPSEMGPEAYPQLEALKAQAVAARTYAVRNLREFEREGYDICATPRCQVYKGMDAEHPLSDRAIAETAGQVLLFEGRLVDALYSSTCGGHTEDGHVIFPLKQEPYLKAVPCMEAGVATLPGDLPAGEPFPDVLTRRLLPPSPAAPPVALAARVEHLALLAGLPVPKDRLASLDRREVHRFLASVFDLALDARLFVSPADVPYLLESPPADWTEEDRRRAAYLVKSGLLSGRLDQPLDEAEVERMLLALAETLQVVRREEAAYHALASGALHVRSGKEDRAYALPERLATFRLAADGTAAAADLALVPGDRLALYWQGERLLAVVQEVEREGVAFDRTSKYASWTRFHSDRELEKLVNLRLPGLGFRDFEILSRGASGRVGKIRIQGSKGETAEVEGLAVRWTLEVPDTLFTARRLEPPGREPGWLFTGRGWGHGVGLCQIGSYGMAQRGHTYREILTHYYTGVELSRVRQVTAGVAGAAAGAGVGR